MRVAQHNAAEQILLNFLHGANAPLMSVDIELAQIREAACGASAYARTFSF